MDHLPVIRPPRPKRREVVAIAAPRSLITKPEYAFCRGVTHAFVRDGTTIRLDYEGNLIIQMRCVNGCGQIKRLFLDPSTGRRTHQRGIDYKPDYLLTGITKTRPRPAKEEFTRELISGLVKAERPTKPKGGATDGTTRADLRSVRRAG